MNAEESLHDDFNTQSRKGSEVGEISARLLEASLENEKNRRGEDVDYQKQDSEEEEQEEVNTNEKIECVSCQQDIDASRPGCMASGKAYHQSCFKCSSCLHEIEGRYFMIEEKPVCDNCYKVESVNCGLCKKPVEGDCMTSNGQNYHSDCMKCSDCGFQLSGKYYSFKDQFICEEDYKKNEKNCHDCGEVIKGPYYTVNSEKVICEKDYKKQLGKCNKCRQIVDGKFLRVSEDAVYHPECFTCTVCDRSLVELKFNFDKGDKKVYCNEDYNKKHATICCTCKEPIVPKHGQKTVERLCALDKNYHSDCFKCEDCGVSLKTNNTGSECYPVNNRPYCADCCKKRQK